MFCYGKQSWNHLFLDFEESTIHERIKTLLQEYHALFFSKVIFLREFFNQKKHCDLCIVDLVCLLREQLHNIKDEEDCLFARQEVLTDFVQNLDTFVLDLVITGH